MKIWLLALFPKFISCYIIYKMRLNKWKYSILLQNQKCVKQTFLQVQARFSSLYNYLKYFQLFWINKTSGKNKKYF